MTRRHEPTCRRVDGDRLVLHEHVRDCVTSGCEGCAPCRPEHGHCHSCRHTHLDADHPVTCPRCVGGVRQDVLTVLDHVAEAHSEQVHRSIASVQFMVAGPAANYEAHSYLHQSATSGRLCKCRRRGLICPAELPPFVGPVCDACVHASCRTARRPRVCPDAAFILEETRDDARHPATVFGGWALTWRRHLDHDPDDTGSLWSYANYLLANLTYMAQRTPDTDEGAPDFRDFARDVRDCRTWLDEVLRLGTRPETGGTCPVCGRADLVKDFDDLHEDTGYTPGNEDVDYNDFWVCPNPACGQVYTDAEYRSKVQGIYLGVADRLTASDLSKRFRIPESTIRRWATGKTPTVRTHGRDDKGRQLYNVADVEAMRDRTSEVGA